MFLFNFPEDYRIIYYFVLILCIVIYVFISQFFIEKESLSSDGKRLVVIAILNTITLSFVIFSGNIESSFFFVLYLLLVLAAPLLTPEYVILEGMIIFYSISLSVIHEYGGIGDAVRKLDISAYITIVSVLITIPVVSLVSRYVENLLSKTELFRFSKELLTIQDIEDEMLFEELDQGVMILDENVKIVKLSKWVSQHFGVTSRVLLGKKVTELPFYDVVSNKRLAKSDYFFKNLLSSEPKKLNWRVLFKNEYGKFIKLVIKQKPVIAKGTVVGFFLFMKLPPKSLRDMLSSFEQYYIFRMSSSIAMVRNILTTSKGIKEDKFYSILEKHMGIIIQLLNDHRIRNDILNGNVEISLSSNDIRSILEDIKRELSSIGKISMWNISPLYKTRKIVVNTDVKLFTLLLTYAIRGAMYLSKNAHVDIQINEDSVAKKPALLLIAKIKIPTTEKINPIEPFFGGKLIVLSKYKGTGLELSNSNLIARYLGFDFQAEIGNNTFIAKIILK